MSSTATAALAAGVATDAAGANEVSAVTVNAARLDPEVTSRTRQETAPNVIETVTQEEVRKLPDINAGEAIARLPGAALSVDTGQGRWVNIRGLDADLTSTTYGGVHLPPTNPVSPQNGGRAFAFDTFPTGMIGSLTITKTNKPEQDAEALGGTVEITPKAIPDGRDHFLELRAGTGEQYSRKTGVVDLSASGGFRFGGAGEDKPFSFVGSLSYYKDALGTDDRRAAFIDKSTSPNLAWSNMTQAYYQFHRTTKGVGGELAYQPDANNRFYARYLYSGYVEDVERDRWVVKTAGASVQNPDGSITSGVKQFDKSLRYMQEQVSLNIAEIGGENQIGAAKVDYHVAFAEGRDYRPYDNIATYTAKPGAASINYNQADYRYPSYTIIGANQLDPSTYGLASVTDNTQLYRTREWTAAVNASLPTHFTGASDEELKVGASARLRTNTHQFNPYTSTAVPAVSLSGVVYGSPIYYYQDHYANGQNISVDGSRNLFQGGAGAGFATNPAANAFAGGAVQQDNREDVYAAYAQEQMTFGKLGILAGLRVETTHASYSGNTSVPTGTTGAGGERGGQTPTFNGSTLLPVSSKADYTNLFPSVQARYELRPDLILRASYSSTIARPGFNQIDPAATIDVANNVVAMGNPNLKPITSNNLDLSVEGYLPHGGIASFNVFDKELSNYIFGRTVFGGITDPVVLGALGNQSTATQVVTYGNIASARAVGFELNYDQKFSFLPGVLSGLGTSLNYTYVDSSGQIRPGENGPLPSTSRNNANAALYWEDDRLSVRGAVSYVGRSLLFVGASRAVDQFTEARLAADLSASYALSPTFSVYVAGRNLLNTAHTITEGSKNRVIQREMFGPAVLVGFTAAL
ncbi:TonB-dependent receptor [Phenylobacterium hankyongense]|uniref:TonB-dependent receptor n=1 Tax=Phenylobacterium hankyongense TaxID=1813876 RepID=UPI001A9EDF73|nr:TonB-dependent receptor [Phenylobacterium hankyongense]